jgi:hypothetical protein
MFNRTDFERVNGFSNDYWGWGFEDTDLRVRCARAGLTIDHRDGTFQSLPHEHRGFDKDGKPTDEARATAATYKTKQAGSPDQYLRDGLSNLRFERVETRAVHAAGNGAPFPRVEHHFIKWN